MLRRRDPRRPALRKNARNPRVIDLAPWVRSNFPRLVDGKYCKDELDRANSKTVDQVCKELNVLNEDPTSMYSNDVAEDSGKFRLLAEFHPGQDQWTWSAQTLKCIQALHTWHSAVCDMPCTIPVPKVKGHRLVGGLASLTALQKPQDVLTSNVLPSLKRVNAIPPDQYGRLEWQLGVRRDIFDVHVFGSKAIYIKPASPKQRSALASMKGSTPTRCDCDQPVFKVEVHVPTLTPKLGPEFIDEAFLIGRDPKTRDVMVSTLWSHCVPCNLNNVDDITRYVTRGTDVENNTTRSISKRAAKLLTTLHVNASERKRTTSIGSALDESGNAWPGRHDWVAVTIIGPRSVRTGGPLQLSPDTRNEIVDALANKRIIAKLKLSSLVNVTVFEHKGLVYGVSIQFGIVVLFMEAVPSGIGVPTNLALAPCTALAHPTKDALCQVGHPALRSLCCTPVATFPPGFRDGASDMRNALHIAELGMILRADQNKSVIDFAVQCAHQWEQGAAPLSMIVLLFENPTASIKAFTALHPGWPYHSYSDLFVFGPSAVRPRKRAPELFIVGKQWCFNEHLGEDREQPRKSTGFDKRPGADRLTSCVLPCPPIPVGDIAAAPIGTLSMMMLPRPEEPEERASISDERK